RLIGRLLDALGRHRLLAVVGPSGSGKSSVVRAGVLPALRQGQLAGSERWFLTTMTPGNQPFEDLADALERVAVDPPADLAGQLASGPRTLASIVERIVPERGHLLLVVDQFEELFTLSADGPDTFLDTLVDALTVERSQLRVILTLRADFYDRPLQHHQFAQLMEESTIAVRPLAPDELERVVVEPAAAVGVRFEPGLVAQITADVADQPGSLPLLQYTLTELFDRRDGDRLTLAAYHELGGVSGSIARQADARFDDSDDDTRTAIRRLMGRLVMLHEGGDYTRRRVIRPELGDAPAMVAAIEALGAARLLSFDRDPAAREQTVEVAHEALLREWPRLRKWLDEDREALVMHRHLTASANDWHNAGRPATELYRGGRLASVTDLTAQDGRVAEFNEVEAAFLDASINQRDAEAAEERRRIRRLRR
ncbi:MAG: ATP-binding protein, partial [Actinomycetota bacterium]